MNLSKAVVATRRLMAMIDENVLELAQELVWLHSPDGSTSSGGQIRHPESLSQYSQLSETSSPTSNELIRTAVIR